MKSIVLVVLGIFALQFSAQCQLKKVEWTAETQKIDNNTYKIIMKADVEEGWYIYSQFMDAGGPLPTSFEFEGKNFSTDGTIDENGEIVKELFDEVFEINVKKYGQQAIFTQTVKTDGNLPNGVARVTFMSCSDDRCNPPTQVELSF